MKVLAYLLYGDSKKYQLELFLSILSALRQLQAAGDRQVQICVMSDGDFAADLPFEHLPIAASELTGWMRSPRGVYNHRIKIQALLKALDHYQCPVALIDTDTYFIDNPVQLFKRISSQKTVMHCLEFAHIADHELWAPMMAQIGDGVEIAGIPITLQSSMFNSGVIGVAPSHARLLEQALQVVDDLYERLPIFNIEQFAVGVALNQFTQLSTSEDLIAHYYGTSRNFIHLQAARMFPDFTATRLEKLMTSAEFPPLGYPPKALADQVMTRILATLRRWHPDYRFAYLAYRSAFFYATRDRDYANVWSAIALQMLQSFQKKHPKEIHWAQVQQDFQRFQAKKIQTLDWLEPVVKNHWIDLWERKIS